MSEENPDVVGEKIVCMDDDSHGVSDSAEGEAWRCYDERLLNVETV